MHVNGIETQKKGRYWQRC